MMPTHCHVTWPAMTCIFTVCLLMSCRSETEALPETPSAFFLFCQHRDWLCCCPSLKLKAGTLGAFRGQCLAYPPGAWTPILHTCKWTFLLSTLSLLHKVLCLAHAPHTWIIHSGSVTLQEESRALVYRMKINPNMGGIMKTNAFVDWSMNKICELSYFRCNIGDMTQFC